MADGKSLQVCHCGWSKVTTYHGLRTHQGKKGCTTKGSTIPKAPQIIFNTYMPKFSYTIPPFELQGPDGYVHCFDDEMVIPQQILDELEKFKDDQTQKELMFPSFSSAPEVAPPQTLHSENPPVADVWQTQPMIPAPKPTLADLSVKKENFPLFGSAQQPLQSSDQGNKTRSALDSVIGRQQFVNQTSSTKTSTANTASATNGKENKPLFQSLQPSSQSALPRTQEFVQASATQAYSNWQNVATPTKEDTQQSEPFFTITASQKTFDLNGKQQPVIKPATFNAQPITSNTRDESMDQGFGATLPTFSMFGDKHQNQSLFAWSTRAQQLQMTKPEPPSSQAINTPPIEMPSTNLLKDLLLSDGALQQPCLGGSPVAVEENEPSKDGHTNSTIRKPDFGSSQSQSAVFTAQPVMSSIGAQQPFYQIPTTQPKETSEGALKEHKPVSSSKPPPATKPTVAHQSGSVNVAQSRPETPKTGLQEENKQFFETPKPSHQPARDGNKTRRALDFSTGAQQAQTSMVIPTTTSQVILPPVDDAKNREAEKLRQIQRDQMKAELKQTVRSREQKLSEIRSCVKACKGSLDEEWLEINSVFSDVIQVVEEARQRALQPLENRKDKLKRDAQSLIKKIQEDIEKLERAIEEVDTAADLDVNPLSKLKLKDFSKSNVDTSFSFGTLQPTVSTMMVQIKEELEKFAALELERVPSFAVEVKLDPTTAHQWLVVSKDGKKVQDGGQSQPGLPPTAGRFDMFGSILGANQFSSGRAYWEVQVGGKSGWDLGVASAKANRKGKLTLSPDNGYWAIVHYEGGKYAALTAPPVCLQLKEKPQKVGLFLDYEEGLVSFYDVTSQSHIYSFTECSFDDGVFPYFSPHLKQNGQNAEPLIITAVKN